MQDRYAGDVGDFGKFALLRAIAAERRLGVCWFMTDGEREKNRDGEHVLTEANKARFRMLDEKLFDELKDFVERARRDEEKRNVASLEALGLLPRGTVFHREHCPRDRTERDSWAHRMVSAMGPCDLVFVDPDNGLEGRSPTPKSVRMEELVTLRRKGRSLVVYHHQSRLAGGAKSEFTSLSHRFRVAGFASVHAVRLRPYTSRFYFVLDGDVALVSKLNAHAERWGDDLVERFLPASA